MSSNFADFKNKMDTPKLLLWSSKPAQLQKPCAAGFGITSSRGRWLGVVEVEVRTIVQEKFHHCPMTSMKTTLELICTLKRNYLRLRQAYFLPVLKKLRTEKN